MEKCGTWAVFRDPFWGHYCGTHFRTIFYTTRILRYQCTRTIINSMRKDKTCVLYLPNFRRVPPLVTNWYDSNLLEGNLKKYQTMSIRNKSGTRGDKMCKENLKLLSLAIDFGLNFDVHISNVCKKVSQKIGVIMRLRNLIPTEAKLHLYKAAILLHLTYFHLVWHFCRASDTRKLQRVQERGLSTVLKTSCLATSSC